MLQWLHTIPNNYWARIFWRVLQGAFWGSGAPLGWVLIQMARGIDPLTDMQDNTLLYLYMLFGTASVFTLFGAYVGLQECRLTERAWRDHLTKLYNLRYFREQLDVQVAQAERDSSTLALIYFDIDHFKKVNDTYGHVAGDKVLVKITECIQAVLRRNELFARIGGEEFAIIVPRSSSETTHNLAERLRKTVETTEMEVSRETKLHVTISIGVVEKNGCEAAHTLVERADQAMYEAKRAGRNRVFIATPLAATA